MLSNHPNCLGGNTPLASIQLDLDFGSTQGSVIYRSASAWTALTPGSSGQFLTTNGAAANPSWGTGTGVLPSQTSNSGKLLTTDGTNAAWTTTGVLTSLTSPASTDLTLGTTDSGAAITVATTNKVGIGTTTPGLYDGEGNDLVVFRAATAGITIAVSDTSSRTSIKFADGTTGDEAYRGAIEYDHGTGLGTADSLHFRTAAALRMAINGSGNVLIGTTSDTGLTGAGGLKINSTTAGSSGAGALFVQGGISAGNSGSAASYFGGAVTVATGNLVIGTAGNGIDFSATAGTGTSELLNDYEEGTWTPTDDSGAGLSFTFYNASYTKIGRLVEVEASILFPSTASTAAAKITGLPFTAANGDDNTGGLSISATNVGANYYMLITRNTNTFTINTNADASVTNVTYSGKVLKFFGWYHV